MKRCSDSKRNRVDARIRRLLGLPVHPEFGREWIEGALGRIAFHLPDSFLLEQLRIIAEQGDTPQAFENGIFGRRLAVLLDFPLGASPSPLTWYSASAVATDTTIISMSVSVPVLSEQIRDTEPRVSTAGRRRMIALRWAMRCTPIASVIVISAGRPSGMADRGADDRLEEFHELHAPHPFAVGEDQDAHHPDHGGDDNAELLDLTQERRFERLTAASS